MSYFRQNPSPTSIANRRVRTASLSQVRVFRLCKTASRSHEDWLGIHLTTLAEYTRGTATLEQCRDPWSSFVILQASFEVLTATQYVIDLCKTLAVEVPNFSSEVQCLVVCQEMRNSPFNDQDICLQFASSKTIRKNMTIDSS